MAQNDLKSLLNFSAETEKMPALFVGHGSPMNAIEENDFVTKWRELGKSIPKPAAILCISAHWETNGTQVTAMQKPPTIHDFGGFPAELYNVRYPAPGSPQLAGDLKHLVTFSDILLDNRWGLDHGAWSVIRNMYPEADVPVIEMSLDYNKSPEDHYRIGTELALLRKKGVLIIGSGNIVHNLRLVAWDHLDEKNFGFDWAIAANNSLKELITDSNIKELTGYRHLGTEIQLAVPTPDHFLPLLYSLSVKEKGEKVTLFNDEAVMGSLYMTSLKIG